MIKRTIVTLALVLTSGATMAPAANAFAPAPAPSFISGPPIDCFLAHCGVSPRPFPIRHHVCLTWPRRVWLHRFPCA